MRDWVAEAVREVLWPPKRIQRFLGPPPWLHELHARLVVRDELRAAAGRAHATIEEAGNTQVETTKGGEKDGGT